MRFITNLIMRFTQLMVPSLNKNDSFEQILRAFEPYSKGSNLVIVEEKARLFRDLILENCGSFQEDPVSLYLVYKYHDFLFNHAVVLPNSLMHKASDCLVRSAALKYPPAIQALGRHILDGGLYEVKKESIAWAWDNLNYGLENQEQRVNGGLLPPQDSRAYFKKIDSITKKRLVSRFEGDNARLSLDVLFPNKRDEEMTSFKI